ncbi:Pogo transposable element with KRAB, partial [Stegodyphus mimosarum]
MSTKRKSYSVEYKKGIVEDSRGVNLVAFCKEKMLYLRMVRKWRADYDYLCQLVDQGNEKKRRVGSGRQPLFSELEDCIWECIAGKRAMALIARRADIKKFALETAIESDISTEEFKASSHWLDNFLKRYELSLRTSTTLFKLEDNEVVKRAFAFKLSVDGIDFSIYQLSNMIAMDETAVFLGQGAQTTVHRKASSSIYVPSTGYDSAHVTCILAIRLDGKKVSPFLITKGKKDQIQRVSGIYVIESENAWCTQAVIRKWVDFMLPPLLKGMTGYLQTLDIAINKPFKDHLRMEINECIETRMVRNHRGNFVKPGLQEVVKWVKNSWDKITDSDVSNALRTGYLGKKYSFNDSYIARHERFGPMIQQEMDLEENQNIIQNFIYDDVPEEDGMTVIE